MENEHIKKKKLMHQPLFQSILSMVVIFGALGGYVYWQLTKDTVYIDIAYLDAPVVTIAPSSAGTLNALYVKEGDLVDPSSPVALLGSETLYAKESGIVSDAPKVIGSYFASGQKVLSVIVNEKMRVIGSLDETKGLNLIAPGQKVTFKVDAFPGNTYEGVVDEVSPASNDTGIAFSISDKRPVKKFDIYIRFDINKYPELKTGMSAKAWVHLK